VDIPGVAFLGVDIDRKRPGLVVYALLEQGRLALSYELHRAQTSLKPAICAQFLFRSFRDHIHRASSSAENAVVRLSCTEEQRDEKHSQR